jgi:RNA polymerase sigma-70 factor, ECF subfamily
VESDSQLVDRIDAGEPRAFAVLVARYERLAMGAALRVVRDTHLAEDVVQDAFVAAFGSLRLLRSRSQFGPWLMAIVRRQAARALRRHLRAPVSATMNGCEPELGASSSWIPNDNGLLDLIERLPTQEHVVIGLRHFQGHSVQEIAEITGRPIGTVTKQLSRAYERLRKSLNEETSG